MARANGKEFVYEIDKNSFSITTYSESRSLSLTTVIIGVVFDGAAEGSDV
jgi:hypothetical protein